ncbi:MAG: hypothetical protein IIC49_06175 [Planctomycetes bacterium]|nr:hypothetical protein [Planctomycetota bacterium]
MGPREFILIGPVPGMIVGVTLLVAWTLFFRGKRRGRGPLWVAPVVFALGFLPAFLANNSIARVWPRDGSYRFPHVALAAMLAGLGCVLIHKPAFVRHVISASALGFCVWVVIGSMPAVSLARADLVVWIVAVFFRRQDYGARIRTILQARAALIQAANSTSGGSQAQRAPVEGQPNGVETSVTAHTPDYAMFGALTSGHTSKQKLALMDQLVGTQESMSVYGKELLAEMTTYEIPPKSSRTVIVFAPASIDSMGRGKSAQFQ